jgi:hypothetical protein
MTKKVFCLRAVRALGIVFLLVAGLKATISVSYGQTHGWSQPVLLSPGEQSSWFPDVAADMTGRVHVVWSANIRTGDDDSPVPEGYDVVMYTSAQDGQEWSEVADIVALPMEAGGTAVTRPALLIDPQGVFHITFKSSTIYYSHAPVESISSAATSWLSPRLISALQVGYYSRLALDRQGRLHLVFTQDIYDQTNLDCSSCSDMFYRQSDDNGLSWSAPTDISNLPTGSAKPQILIDGQGYIHVIWEEGPGIGLGQLADPTRIMYAASYDRGKTWTPPAEFVTPSGQARNAAIGLDGGSKLLVVWLNLPEDVVYYQLSRDQGHSWSPPEPIPGVWGGWSVYSTRLDDYAMATDSAGNTHLVLVGRTAEDQESLSVLHLTWDGSNWSESEAITTLVGSVPEWPRIAIGLGNQLHVVWFVRDEPHIWESEKGEYQIWYAHGTSSAPVAAPAVWPTSTPIPILEVVTTPIPVATPTLLPTPTSTLDPGLTQIDIPPGTTDSIYTEMDDLILLAKSLVPAALVIAVVVIGVHVWRR